MTDFVRFDARAVDGFPTAVAEVLLERGLPRRVITIFTAASSVAGNSRSFGKREVDGLVVGFSREDDELFVDFESGRVWLLASWGAGEPILTNGDLRSFVDSLVLVESRYPFYPPDRDLDIAEQAEESLRGALEEIDSASTADPDGFWSAFLDDVASGDYAGTATE